MTPQPHDSSLSQKGQTGVGLDLGLTIGGSRPQSPLRHFLTRLTPGPLRKLSIRWRLAIGAALLTLIVLGVFTVVISLLVGRELRKAFDHEVSSGATAVAHLAYAHASVEPLSVACSHIDVVTADDNASFKLFSANNKVVCATPRAPRLGPPTSNRSVIDNYRVELRTLRTLPNGQVLTLQYVRPLAPEQATVDSVYQLMAIAVGVGVLLAFLAGLGLARYALDPIVDLTEAAREIERTLDMKRKLPEPLTRDELGELGRTLDRMLHALETSRAKTEELLDRQRKFVADASHELGTPLTSLLANLEFIVDELEGEEGEAGASAVRSALRMRALISDLLLLARTDAGRAGSIEAVDLSALAIQAAQELRPLAKDHVLEVVGQQVGVEGIREDLYRLVLNLLSNAIRHTPAGTHIRAQTSIEGESAVLLVQDDGPGIPPAIADRVFERFVKGTTKRTSTGLGLAIVRAVAETHAGDVKVVPGLNGKGVGFRVEIPIHAVSASQ